MVLDGSPGSPWTFITVLNATLAVPAAVVFCFRLTNAAAAAGAAVDVGGDEAWWRTGLHPTTARDVTTARTIRRFNVTSLRRGLQGGSDSGARHRAPSMLVPETSPNIHLSFTPGCPSRGRATLRPARSGYVAGWYLAVAHRTGRTRGRNRG